MRHACGITIALLLAVLVTQAYSLEAAATVVNLDEFAVARNGATIFDDSFDRNITLNGGSGMSVPSGTTFSDGSPANYFVQGAIPETTANNGQAQWNTANGIVVGQPPREQTNASLQTGMNPAGPHTLTPANTFSGIVLFDLAVPPISGQYQFYLTNNTATPGQEARVAIIPTSTGPCCGSCGWAPPTIREQSSMRWL